MTSLTNAEDRQTSRFVQKREVILDAALRLFHQRGVDGTTLTDVAERVGLATNSVTYYFRRKENLVVACFERTFGIFNGLIDSSANGATVEDRVTAYIRNYFRLLAEIETRVRPDVVSFSNVLAVRGAGADAVRDAYSALFRRMRELVDDGGPASENRTRLNVRAHLLMALTQWGRVWLNRYEPDGYARAADQAANIMIHGIASPGAVWPTSDIERMSLTGEGAVAGAHLSRDQFLPAATRLINEQGVHGVSVERISASLDVTKGAFYHHNPTKEALIADCFEHSFAVIRTAQHKASLADTGWARLCVAATDLVRYQLSDAGPLLGITARTGLPAKDSVRMMNVMNRLSERFAGFVVDGVIDGSVRPVDPTAAAQLVNAMINASATVQRWVPGVNADNGVEYFVKPLFFGMLTSPET